jgi:hypothetical protein
MEEASLQISTNRDESRNCSRRNSPASTTLKMAVFAPTPSASAATANTKNDGLRRSERRLYRKSEVNPSSIGYVEISFIATIPKQLSSGNKRLITFMQQIGASGVFTSGAALS